jgi:polar amino acid transport system substrate-binding protein
MKRHAWIGAMVAGALLVVGTLGALPGAQAAPKVLRFGADSSPYPPFTSQNAQGKWVGFEVDLMNAICKVENLKCRMVGIAFDGIIPALNSHKIDVIWSSMSITPAREKLIDFTDKYYNTPADVIVLKSNPIHLTLGDFSGLKGKTVGAQSSTTEADFIQKKLAGIATPKTYDSQDAVNADLLAGRIDAMLADSVAMDSFLKSDQGKDAMVALSIPADYDRAIFGDGVGGGVRKSDQKLKATLNDGIKKVLANGTYKKLEQKYFSFDVYGS